MLEADLKEVAKISSPKIAEMITRIRRTESSQAMKGLRKTDSQRTIRRNQSKGVHKF